MGTFIPVERYDKGLLAEVAQIESGRAPLLQGVSVAGIVDLDVEPDPEHVYFSSERFRDRPARPKKRVGRADSPHDQLDQLNASYRAEPVVEDARRVDEDDVLDDERG